MSTINNFEHLVGIIGGVGPEATNYFTSLLIKKRGQVTRDQDHIPFLLFNNPQIPDRSKYLMYGGQHFLPEMVKTGMALKNAGASFLVVTCNTAHTHIEELEKTVGIPVLNMIDLTVKYICDTYGEDITVGLLATTGTINSSIYKNTFKKYSPHANVLIPFEKTQAEVMRACYEIKKFSVDENNFQLLDNAAQELIRRGASVIILGCTEIPLALTQEKCSYKRIDPMEILARETIKQTLRSRVTISKQHFSKNAI